MVGVLHDLHRPEDWLSDHRAQPRGRVLREDQRLSTLLNERGAGWRGVGRRVGSEQLSPPAADSARLENAVCSPKGLHICRCAISKLLIVISLLDLCAALHTLPLEG